MRAKTRTASFAVVASAALLLGACGGDDDGDGGNGAEGSGDGPTGTVSINSTQPQHALIPSDTNEVGGGNIVDAMWTGLVSYDSETAEPSLAVAESIEPNDDFTEFTITVNDGWTFHDGTPVTAQSFVDAWNYAAYGPNGQQNSYFFGPEGVNITGFADIQGEIDDDGNVVSEPAAETMSGLVVEDDTTFTVSLDSPNALFETMIGYSAFFPMPESFFEDPEAFGDAPVGNGPFKFEEYVPNQQITLSAYEDYAGDTQPSVETVEYRIYADLDAAYADVQSNTLDVLDKIPSVGLAGEVYKSDLEGRSAQEPLTTRFTSITFPLDNTDQWQDPNLRKAISMAIDRPAVIETAYGSEEAYVPATGWVPPGNEGYQENACGQWCEFNPDEAKQLWDAASDAPESIQIASNGDGGHREWVEAACTSIQGVLEVQCTGDFSPDFGTFRNRITAEPNEVTQPFRTGWVADYPSIQNFLAPLYTANGSANDGGYVNEEFDALIREAITLEGDEANALYNEAETLLAEDMAVIPLWYDNGIRGWSENIDEPLFTWKGYVDPLSLSVKS